MNASTGQTLWRLVTYCVTDPAFAIFTTDVRNCEGWRRDKRRP